MTVIPSGHNVEVTCNMTFTAVASGVGVAHFTYQWKHNESTIDNQNEKALMITNAMESDGGCYACFVTNPYGDLLHNLFSFFISFCP